MGFILAIKLQEIALGMVRALGLVGILLLLSCSGGEESRTLVTGTNLKKCPRSDLNSKSIDANYAESATGSNCLLENSNGSNFLFSVNGQRMMLADPTISKIDGRYFLIGTSDAYNAGNIAIYVSSDLVNWEFFNTAFDEATRTGDRVRVLSNPVRHVCNIWSPRLTPDPSDPNLLNLYITATQHETGHANVMNCDRNYQERININTVYYLPISKEDFLAKRYAWQNLSWLTYTVNDVPYNAVSSPFRYDGGYAQSLAEGRSPQNYKTIPVTGNPNMTQDPPVSGQPIYNGERMCHLNMGCNTWIANDGFHFFDPATSQRWLVYSWIDGDPSRPFWYGGHIAAYPMLNGFLMKATAQGKHLPLGFKRNTHNSVGNLDNGLYGRDAVMPGNYGVAEGPRVFVRNGKYYLYFNRNGWDSPAYGIFYRMADSFEGLAVRNADGSLNWAKTDSEERPLLISKERMRARGPSYGTGEIFEGPQGRWYVLAHLKDDQSEARTPILKELTFTTDGHILPLSNDDANGPSQDARVVLVPRQ